MNNKPITHLNSRYILVLFIIGILSVLSTFLLQSLVNSQKSSSAVINDAGRQRMLSQRIVFLTYQIEHIDNEEVKYKAIDKLKVSIELMRNTHNLLSSGSKNKDSSILYSKELEDIYFNSENSLDKQLKHFLEVTELKLAQTLNGKFNKNQWYKYTTNESDDLLASLNFVVGLYQHENEEKIATLQYFQYIALFITIIVLISSGLLIFKPIMQRVKSYVQELEVAEERFRSITNSSSIAMIVAIDESGKIVSWNPAATLIFGYEKNEIIGKPLEIIIPPRFRDAHNKGIHRVATTGEKRIIGSTVELAALKKDGSEFPIELSLGSWKKGEKIYFSAIIHDISDRVKIEESLRRSQKMDAIGELSGGVAHDFNNLLAIIVGNLDLAKRKVEPDSKLEKQITKAHKAALRGATLTRRLLNFSRKTPDNKELSPSNISGIIKEIEILISKSLMSDISVSLNLYEDLWNTDIDPGDFEDTIINLAINARDAMPDGGQLIIETKNTVLDEKMSGLKGNIKAGEYVEMVISDTGTGMSKEISEKIFEPFFTTKGKDKGTGLGMAMVYGFVTRCKGYISVYSEEGIGTTFRVYLPKSVQSHINKRDNLISNDVFPKGSETVLIVDDEIELVELAKSILEDLGYNIICANSGDEAIKIINEIPSVDLLFSDVVMPGKLNGFSLADEANKLRPNLKVLLTSGFTGSMPHSHSSKKKSETLLSKPYRDIELAKRIRQTLDNEEIL